jgi:hypothetical protein
MDMEVYIYVQIVVGYNELEIESTRKGPMIQDKKDDEQHINMHQSYYTLYSTVPYITHLLIKTIA